MSKWLELALSLQSTNDLNANSAISADRLHKGISDHKSNKYHVANIANRKGRKIAIGSIGINGGRAKRIKTPRPATNDIIGTNGTTDFRKREKIAFHIAERAAILAYDAGLFRIDAERQAAKEIIAGGEPLPLDHWRQKLQRLLKLDSTEEWIARGLKDGLIFLEAWGPEAVALGWAEEKLFSLCPFDPQNRPDRHGLIFSIRGGWVIELTRDLARIESRAGRINSRHRHVINTDGDGVPIWDHPMTNCL